MNPVIPYAAYHELQSRFLSLVHQKFLTSGNGGTEFRNAFNALGEPRQLALLNCLIPSPQKALIGEKDHHPMEFLNTIGFAHQEAASTPLNPRNDIDWNRLLELSQKSAEVGRVMSALTHVGFDEFVYSYNSALCESRMSHCTDLEYQTSQATHVRCPESSAWMHQTVFYRQFEISGVAFTGTVRNFGQYGGHLPGLLNEVGARLSGFTDTVMLAVSQFGRQLAKAEYEDGRIRWSYKASPVDPQVGYTPVSASRFYAMAEAMAQKMGLNNNKRAFLDSDLSL